MRIAMLSWESLHSHYVGGVAVVVTELAAALERKGHDVHVFTRMSDGQPCYERIDGVHYHRCPFELHSDFIEEINNMCRSFVHHVRETECFAGAFDIIHAHDWLTANAMIWIKHMRHCRGVLTIHSTEYGRCGNNFWDGRSASIREIERAGIFWADRVTTVSHSLRDEIIWMYNAPPKKTKAIYNGVNLHRFDGWLSPGAVKATYEVGAMDPMVLFCGRMVYQKGPDLLVESIPAILCSHPQAKFVFAGDGDMRWHAEERANDLDVMHATRFLGNKSNGELTDLFKACDVVCVPSRNEPFGIVILEAWSAGKPVAVSQIGGPREFVWHKVNGLKIYPHPESIAWGLNTLFANFEWARWLGANGRLTVEARFSWDVVGDQVLSVYEEIG